MTQPTVKLTTTDNSAKVTRDLDGLNRLQVYVGVPEANSGRKKGKDLNNAQLAFILTNGVRSGGMKAEMDQSGKPYGAALALYLHTHGSPLYRVPPRPIIEPAIEAKGNREAILAQLKKAGEALLDGRKIEAIRFLHLAGQEAENRCRAWFTDPRNNWPPNAPSTVKRKGSSQPNIDTAQLRRSITHVVEE